MCGLRALYKMPLGYGGPTPRAWPFAMACAVLASGMKTMAWLSGLATGGGLMYLFDPDHGRRRRALLRDQLTRLGRRAGDLAEAGLRDASNRTGGMLSEVQHFAASDDASDQVLEARVRAALGMVTRHAGALEVRVEDGFVTLRGPVLAAVAPRVRSAVHGVRGVRGLQDALEVHETPGDVRVLQGPEAPDGAGAWSPAARAAATLGALSFGMPLALRLVQRMVFRGGLQFGAAAIALLAWTAAREERASLARVRARRVDRAR